MIYGFNTITYLGWVQCAGGQQRKRGCSFRLLFPVFCNKIKKKKSNQGNLPKKQTPASECIFGIWKELSFCRKIYQKKVPHCWRNSKNSRKSVFSFTRLRRCHLCFCIIRLWQSRLLFWIFFWRLKFTFARTAERRWTAEGKWRRTHAARAAKNICSAVWIESRRHICTDKTSCPAVYFF